MPRLFALALLLLVPVAVAAPVPKAKKKAVPSVEGTTWVSNEQEQLVGVIEYTFQPEGKLVYRYVKTGASYTEGSWKQDGDTLYWECNRKYAEFDLTFADGKFAGGAHNITGKKWDVSLTPKEEK